MKPITAILLAAASTASAQTSWLGFALGPFSVQTLAESHTARTDFTAHDLDDGTITACATAWNIGDLGSPSLWFPCTDNSFQFRFSTGIANVENFTLQITRTSEAGTVVAEANFNARAENSPYVCETPGNTPGTETECRVRPGPAVVAQPIV